MSDDTTARVCVHGGLRRQCEACDLADRLEVAEAEVRRLQQEQDRQRIARIEAIEQGNSLAQRLIEQRDDARAERDEARHQASELSTAKQEVIDALTAERDAAIQRAEQAEAEAERAWHAHREMWQDRYDALDARTTEGMSAAEWQLRTGKAERRAREAEAALAQAQEAIAEIEDIVIDGDDPAALREAIDRSRLPGLAQPPALPPLPEGWVREGVRDIILYRSHDRYTGVDGHVPPGGQVSVHAEGLRVSTTHVPVADLLIVLRHAEAAHLKMKEGTCV